MRTPENQAKNNMLMKRVYMSKQCIYRSLTKKAQYQISTHPQILP